MTSDPCIFRIFASFCSIASDGKIGYTLLVHQHLLTAGAKATKFVMFLRFTQPILHIDDINVVDASDAHQFIDHTGIADDLYLS